MKREPKPKHVMSLQRFMQRPTSLMGAQMDVSLAQLGLQDILPSHAYRLPGCVPGSVQHALVFLVRSW